LTSIPTGPLNAGTGPNAPVLRTHLCTEATTTFSHGTVRTLQTSHNSCHRNILVVRLLYDVCAYVYGRQMAVQAVMVGCIGTELNAAENPTRSAGGA
jgi:hypothetical protein